MQTVRSFTLLGASAVPVTVEVDILRRLGGGALAWPSTADLAARVTS